MKSLITYLLLFVTFHVPMLHAVEVAPRITDREIIESLAELKAGQKALNQRFDDMQRETNQRFDDMQRETSQRFNSLESTMLTLFSAMIMLIVALFGYIAWDRRTALKPLEEEVQKLRREVERDLDLRSPEGSMLTRAVQALRELSKDDPKMASVLRSYSLL